MVFMYFILSEQVGNRKAMFFCLGVRFWQKYSEEQKRKHYKKTMLISGGEDWDSIGKKFQKEGCWPCCIPSMVVILVLVYRL